MQVGLSSAGLRRVLFATLLVLAAVGVRVWLGNLGFNRDVESYVVVERIVAMGGNVYAETGRYNYGPVWFYVVHAVALASHLFADRWTAFLLLLSLVLAFADVLIAGLLHERDTRVAALLFLFCPISIVISGFHRQFDNLALLLTLVAVLLLERSAPDRLDRAFAAGILALGLSLCVKHVFFAVPLWLAAKEERWPRRIALLVAPPLLFLASLLPFWVEGGAGIVDHVFRYQSLANAPLWRSLFGPEFGGRTGPMALFLVALVAGAWLDRRRDRFGGVLTYTVVLVAFAPAIANQYLAIPVAAACVFFNPFFASYWLVGGAHLVFDPGETGRFVAPVVAANLPNLFPVEVWLLLGGLLWEAAGEWRRQRRMASTDGRVDPGM